MLDVIQTRTPGKLYIAGEYAVVEPGYSAIIAAVDLFIYVSIREVDAGKGRLYSEGFTTEAVSWNRCDGFFKFQDERLELDYVLSAIQTTEEYLDQLGVSMRTFDLQIRSELDSLSNKKLGLGSSGAVTVAVVRSLLKFYDVEDSDLLVFKLAVLSQLRLGVNSSFGDLAASTYTGWIKYSSFDRQYLESYIATHSLKETIDGVWPYLDVKELKVSSDIQLMIGWTGSPASSNDLVGNVQNRKKQSQEKYQHFLNESKLSVTCLVDGLISFDQQKVVEAVKRNRAALFQMGQDTHIAIETSQLTELIEIAERYSAVAKTSGAGGGDSGIAFVFEDTQQNKIIEEWKQADIRRLPLKVFEK